MNLSPEKFDVVTVTLNPAIDRTLTIPQFAAGHVNRVQSERSHPGGKGVNVASALAGHGLLVAATGFLGRDNPESFETLFEQKEIEDCFVRIAGATRTGIKITDPVQVQTTDINFPGFAPKESDLEALEAELADLEAEYFVLAGSLPVGVDPGIYARLIRSLHLRGMRVALDTSGVALREGIEAGPDLIKPNLLELEEFLGKKLENQEAILQAASTLVSTHGIGLVVITMGKEGALFVNADEAIAVRPPEVEVGSTVGAGDAMIAGIIAGILAKLPLEECARLASAFSLNLLTEGRSQEAASVERLSLPS